MSRVYVGNLDPRTTESELEDEFRFYGILRSVWVARRPPGYAFVEFDDKRDATDAIRGLDGKHGWRVQLSHKSAAGTAGTPVRRGGDDSNCYECGQPGHFARECRLRIGPSGFGSGIRRASRSPPCRRSPSYGNRNSPLPHRRSISPPSHYRSRSPPRYYGNTSSKRYERTPSPPNRRGRGSLFTNGSPYGRDRY